jgi:hypothetical protein
MRWGRTTVLSSLAVFATLLSISAVLWGLVAPSDTELAEKFVSALNRGDTKGLVADSAYPFVFRNQEWESANDGSGFVHGKAEDRYFRNRSSLEPFLESLVKKVRIESEIAAKNPPSKQALLSDNFKGAPQNWRGLTLVVFTRGFGDVEHVAIVGIDSARHKVRGLYLN